MPADSSQVLASFAKLAVTSATLNAATDRLNRAVERLEEALKTLNLGITSWVQFSMSEDGPFWTTEEFGYAKINGKWRISLKKTDGNQNLPNSDEIEDETAWPFVEAPREMRIRAIVHLQKLMDKLDEDASKAAAIVESKSADAERLAEAFAQAAAAADLRPPPIRLDSITKPGDALKAILDRKQSENAAKAASAVSRPTFQREVKK